MPVSGPPDPFRISSWATDIGAATLTWTQTTTINDVAYGRFKDGSNNPWYLVAGAAGSTPNAGQAWGVGTSVPTNCVEHLMTLAAAEVIRDGTPNTDGSITYSSTSYRMTQQVISGTLIM